jgi:hypothetical protein
LPDDTTRADLARLRALVATQEARLARLERRRPATRRLVPAVTLALLLALVPLSLLAATPFTDLTGGVHDQNIDAIYNAGVTTGCVPNAEYCPTANVTREEMASFLARLGGLGSNPPVANAKTAQTATTATHATTADTATNATNATSAQNATNAQNAAAADDSAALGGQPASAYLLRGADDFAVLRVGQAAGPLPKSFTFTSHGGHLLLFVSASAYGTAEGAIGVAVDLDGTQVALLQVSINETLSHKGFPPIIAARAVPAGVHTVTFALSTLHPATGTDNYDAFNLTVLELPID